MVHFGSLVMSLFFFSNWRELVRLVLGCLGILAVVGVNFLNY
jgi:glucose uptake protein GlcU